MQTIHWESPADEPPFREHTKSWTLTTLFPYYLWKLYVSAKHMSLCRTGSGYCSPANSVATDRMKWSPRATRPKLNIFPTRLLSDTKPTQKGRFQKLIEMNNDFNICSTQVYSSSNWIVHSLSEAPLTCIFPAVQGTYAGHCGHPAMLQGPEGTTRRSKAASQQGPGQESTTRWTGDIP